MAQPQESDATAGILDTQTIEQAASVDNTCPELEGDIAALGPADGPTVDSQDIPSRSTIDSSMPLPRPEVLALLSNRSHLHQGWTATYYPMAKCDFCERQGRPVLQKCDKCKMSICVECYRSGKLAGNSLHEIDSSTVVWYTGPGPDELGADGGKSAKRRSARGGSRGRRRGRGKVARVRGGGRVRKIEPKPARGRGREQGPGNGRVKGTSRRQVISDTPSPYEPAGSDTTAATLSDDTFKSGSPIQCETEYGKENVPYQKSNMGQQTASSCSSKTRERLEADLVADILTDMPSAPPKDQQYIAADCQNPTTASMHGEDVGLGLMGQGSLKLPPLRHLFPRPPLADLRFRGNVPPYPPVPGPTRHHKDYGQGYKRENVSARYSIPGGESPALFAGNSSMYLDSSLEPELQNALDADMRSRYHPHHRSWDENSPPAVREASCSVKHLDQSRRRDSASSTLHGSSRATDHRAMTFDESSTSHQHAQGSQHNDKIHGSYHSYARNAYPPFQAQSGPSTQGFNDYSNEPLGEVQELGTKLQQQTLAMHADYQHWTLERCFRQQIEGSWARRVPHTLTGNKGDQHAFRLLERAADFASIGLGLGENNDARGLLTTSMLANDAAAVYPDQEGDADQS
ncbi:hypothetical protein S40285_06154 [Stachybotrys chlorohalonatus IBT 40285]|uniref:ZZ-type domain-containing protein n=1 Tax=Stachybotrys chlorohalonatus (strain IBT 40285) TaxID=1283841 RepID=A0A084QL27_STAC4|nr:hypothetical protein S40285_06154 [Stachybotrys chlorohalonata IBT 40285]